MAQRVGIMGGTFDPVHIGHLRVAEEAAEALNLDRLLFIPAACPPHKPDKKITSFEDRWRMLDLAVSGNPRFGLSDVERRLGGKSYTVVTLRKLNEESGAEREFFFLVGLDAFLEIDTWWHFMDLFRLARLVVLRRPGYREEHMDLFLAQRVSASYARDDAGSVFRHPELLPVHYVDNTALGISSTRIRRLAAEGKSVRYLVPGEILRYIQKNNLYAPENSEESAREGRRETCRQ